MLTYESQVHVERPPSTVFPYSIEPQKQVLWSGLPMKQLTDGPLTTGSRMEVTFGMGPIKATVGLELTAVEPGRRMAFRSFSGPIRWDGEYRLESSGASSTEVSQKGRLVFTGLWRLVEPLVGAEISRGEVRELERLKAVVEERADEKPTDRS
jgi:hypothetical protein